MDNAMMECPDCGTAVVGNSERFGCLHAEFDCEYCGRCWLGTIGSEEEEDGRINR